MIKIFLNCEGLSLPSLITLTPRHSLGTEPGSEGGVRSDGFKRELFNFPHLGPGVCSEGFEKELFIFFHLRKLCTP